MLLWLPAKIIAALTGREPSGVEGLLRGLLYWRKRIHIGRYVEFVGRPNIHLGEGVSLYGSSYLNANGGAARIVIGERTHIDRNCVLQGQGGLDIGAGCAIAAGVIIYTQTNQYRSDTNAPVLEQPVLYAPVKIGNHVWIGAGAIILPGVRVEDHAVIGAGSVVTRDVMAGAIVAGVPSREISARRPI